MPDESRHDHSAQHEVVGHSGVAAHLKIPASFNITDYFLYVPALAHPGRPAILGEPAPVTYGELASLTKRVSLALSREGIAPAERVLIVLPDSVEFIAAFMGVVAIGAVAVPVNPMARESDYAHYLRDSGARLVIVHESALAEFVPAAKGFRASSIVVVGENAPGAISAAPAGSLRWQKWLPASAEHKATRNTLATDTAFFLYTSGSGGTPKAAVHQHKDMLATTHSFARGILGITSEDRTYSVSKLFFAYGLGNGMYFPFSAGAGTILDSERPKPDRTAALLITYRPTIFFAVPTFYSALLHAAEQGLPIDFSSVRLAVSAGERLPPEILEKFKARFGLEILDAIGSTEMLHMFLSPERGRGRPGSCGFPVPSYEAKIVDDEGAPVAQGEIGNLWVKGASAFSEYWNIPELTKHTKIGDWVVTGDKFFTDADGYYHYCGRADDMMKVSGMWVAPTEVENALLGHPSVVEAAVVGVIESSGLTRPLAFVVIPPGVAPTDALAEDMRQFVRGKLAGYKCPAEIKFLHALPKTATGKIQRFRLRSGSSEQSNTP